MNQNQINFHKDELIVSEILSTLKIVILNIFIFILCIFLFMNPYLLSNVILFISVFVFIKVSISFFSSSFETQEQSLVEQTLTVHAMDEDENEILRNKIRKLKRDNNLLKDKNNLKRKMKTFTPKIISNPIEINVQFDEKDDELSNDIEISLKDAELSNEIKDDELSSNDVEISSLKDSLSSEEESGENFSILDKEDEWTS